MNMQWFFLILGALLGIVGSLVASAVDRIYGDNFLGIYFKIFPGGWTPKRNLSLEGRWTACWQVDSPNYPPKVEDFNAEIKQFGNRIVAHMSSPLPGRAFRCRLEGVIENQHTITGRWYDEVANAPSYYGVFQFIYDRRTGNFSGKWIGFSQRGDVKAGQWEWTRYAEAISVETATGQGSQAKDLTGEDHERATQL